MDTIDDQVYVMLKCKQQLECCKSNIPKYNEICNSIKNFLLKYCQHEIVEDYIDTSPDNSSLIRYCIKCETTFHK